MSASLRPDAPPRARAYAYEVSPDGTCTPPMTFAHAYNSGIWDHLSDDEQDEMLARKSPYMERREAADAKADLIAEFKARADTEKLKSKVEHVRLCDLLLCPVNADVYGEQCMDDPRIISLIQSIREHGVMDPLTSAPTT